MVSLIDFGRVFHRKKDYKSAARKIYSAINKIEGYNLPSGYEVVIKDIEQFYSIPRRPYLRKRLEPKWHEDRYEHFQDLQSGRLGFREVLVIYYWFHCEFPYESENLEREIHGDTIENRVAELKKPKKKRKPANKIVDGVDRRHESYALQERRPYPLVDSVKVAKFQSSCSEFDTFLRKNKLPSRVIIKCGRILDIMEVAQLDETELVEKNIALNQQYRFELPLMKREIIVVFELIEGDWQVIFTRKYTGKSDDNSPILVPPKNRSGSLQYFHEPEETGIHFFAFINYSNSQSDIFYEAGELINNTNFQEFTGILNACEYDILVTSAVFEKSGQ